METLAVFLIVTCLTLDPVVSAGTAPSPTSPTRHFTAKCKDDGSADITLVAGYKIVPATSVTCTPKPGGTSTQTFPDTCAKNGITFSIVDNATRTRTSLDQTYKFTCLESGDGHVETVTLKSPLDVGIPSSTKAPITQTAKYTPAFTQLNLQLLLLKTVPLSNAPSTVASVTLGEELFLTIFSNSGSTDNPYLIPISCSAEVSASDNITLTDLNDQVCNQQTGIITETFKYGTPTTGPGEYAAIKMKAFQFTDDQKSAITFTCSVRVCSQIRTGTQCETDYKNRDCTSAATGPVTGRRRREVFEDEIEHGEVHHLTATLRVQDPLLPSAAAGHVTLSWFVLAVLSIYFL